MDRVTDRVRGELQDARVLLVEDEPLYLEFVERVVRDLGITHVETAGDGCEALSRVQGSYEFDLVICDWKMPNMDGLTFLRHSRKRYPRAKFLFMSSNCTLEDVFEATQAGVANYLAKPVLVGELQEEIIAMLTWRWPLKHPRRMSALSARHH